MGLKAVVVVEIGGLVDRLIDWRVVVLAVGVGLRLGGESRGSW